MSPSIHIAIAAVQRGLGYRVDASFMRFVPSGVRRDQRLGVLANRDLLLRSNGFRVLRFWNGDVLARTDAVV